MRVGICLPPYICLKLLHWQLYRYSTCRISECGFIPGDTRHSSRVELMLGQRRRRWLNIELTLAGCTALAWFCVNGFILWQYRDSVKPEARQRRYLNLNSKIWLLTSYFKVCIMLLMRLLMNKAINLNDG